ncbi:hypothetical protein JI750_12295 [Flavobacterium sp. GN10]|uniref:Uncharacterized protein n=1 Tax=Flavobacterium tagetis TaxID=2801336 RepID=A0ABS1KG69_9FLAO|nr:hypothetical protein [Flavobacterium tagetis]MBL0737677.1 hypothetical protein [Flavobacterium tagetis]
MVAKNWKIIIVGLLFLVAYPAFNLIKEHYATPERPKPLGAFNVTFINNLEEPITLNNLGEFYIHAPETPGTNRQITSGLIEFEFPPKTYVLEIKPSKSITISAELANEKRLLQYLDTEEFFALIMISATPKPLHEEVLFKRETFKNGIKIIIDEIKDHDINIKK